MPFCFFSTSLRITTFIITFVKKRHVISSLRPPQAWQLLTSALLPVSLVTTLAVAFKRPDGVVATCVQWTVVFVFFALVYIFMRIVKIIVNCSSITWLGGNQIKRNSPGGQGNVRQVENNTKVMERTIVKLFYELTLSLPRVISFKFAPSASPDNYITITHSMKNLTFHSFIRWKMTITINSHYLLHTIIFKRLGEYTFRTWEWKG